jgi:hypothetical protein
MLLAALAICVLKESGGNKCKNTRVPGFVEPQWRWCVQVTAEQLPLPGDPQSSDDKAKRHRQVWQAEVDEAASKAIQRYIFMAFNDTTGEATADSNPIMRENRLTSSNPLL